MQEVVEEELKRVRIKEKSKHMRDLVKTDQGNRIPCEVYPLFEPGTKSRCEKESQKEALHEQERLTKSVEPTRKLPEPSPVQTIPKMPASQTPKPEKTDFKKKEKPAWMLTTAETSAKEDAEVNDLLDFMENFDAEKYAEDVQIRSMIGTLKTRVDELKKEDGWKQRWEERLKEKRKKREEEYLREKAEKEAKDDDMIVQVGDEGSKLGIQGGSVGSRGEARSVQSEKTQGTLATSNHRNDTNPEGEGRAPVTRQRRLGQVGQRQIRHLELRGPTGETHCRRADTKQSCDIKNPLEPICAQDTRAGTEEADRREWQHRRRLLQQLLIIDVNLYLLQVLLQYPHCVRYSRSVL